MYTFHLQGFFFSLFLIFIFILLQWSNWCFSHSIVLNGQPPTLGSQSPVCVDAIFSLSKFPLWGYCIFRPSFALYDPPERTGPATAAADTVGGTRHGQVFEGNLSDRKAEGEEGIQSQCPQTGVCSHLAQQGTQEEKQNCPGLGEEGTTRGVRVRWIWGARAIQMGKANRKIGSYLCGSGGHEKSDSRN